MKIIETKNNITMNSIYETVASYNDKIYIRKEKVQNGKTIFIWTDHMGYYSFRLFEELEREYQNLLRDEKLKNILDENY
jgi:hypothetical protein